MRGWLRDRLEKRAHQVIIAHLRATRTPVKVEPTQGMFNFRCHENTVEWQRQRPDHTVVETIYIDDGQPILHYIARDPAGALLEVTLGWRADELEYYVLRDILVPRSIYKEFNSSLEYWLHFSTPTWLRWLSGLKRVL
ncbi:hypothetical protein P9A48_gp03 [Xanthomonas phage Mallos]|uniref:Uncharacterized protein n=1 Tax=Xanthomonas phage Mallos TaxID=2939131 RepID=A0A9E7E1Z7_9CAUD|nr:hypothetical protein P9A48_gp03 [Xanthomonas phage Mallos]URA07111.1 hypothetical protein Mallos_BL6003 [Xanthomonas phage Mallos]